jgi:hypothetical protein
MKLTVESLRGSGGYSGAPVKKHIKWQVGDDEYDADVYVRKLSYKSAIIDAKAITEGGDIAALRISHCIVDENGNQVFPSVSDVTGVNPDGSPVMDEVDGEVVPRGSLGDSIANALFMAIHEVNPMGKQKGRKSARKKSSGTNSSSAASEARQ